MPRDLQSRGRQGFGGVTEEGRAVAAEAAAGENGVTTGQAWAVRGVRTQTWCYGVSRNTTFSARSFAAGQTHRRQRRYARGRGAQRRECRGRVRYIEPGRGVYGEVDKVQYDNTAQTYGTQTGGRSWCRGHESVRERQHGQRREDVRLARVDKRDVGRTGWDEAAGEAMAGWHERAVASAGLVAGDGGVASEGGNKHVDGAAAESQQTDSVGVCGGQNNRCKN